MDLGTTAISAVLMEQQTGQRYPLSWVVTSPTAPSAQRLSTIVSLTPQDASSAAVLTLAAPAIAPATAATTEPRSTTVPTTVALRQIKPFLNLALPYYAADSQTWEPHLQSSDQHSVTLATVRDALTQLLHLLRERLTMMLPEANSPKPGHLQAALPHLAGVIISCPDGWSDAYRFNVREALLASECVTSPEQIFFLEDAIAALLSEFPTGTSGLTWQGATLVLSAGATTTELLLTNLPADLASLTRTDLHSRSLAYAGDALDQDIICQLLYPHVEGWDRFGLPPLALPLPGDPDRAVRQRLQQQLQTCAAGERLQAAAKQIKLALQQQPTLSFRLFHQQWTISRTSFQQHVLLPYIQRLNRELNQLLTETGLTAESVQRMICTGGTTALPAIAHWLKQKLPHATLLQDRDPTACSRIACGLAQLPLYPHLLDVTRHQYSDFFLLQELLRGLPAYPLPLSRILQLLEKQGINTQACQRSLLNLLEGKLPAGLIPAEPDADLLTPASRQLADYQILTAAPLCLKPDRQQYVLNLEVRDRWQAYLTQLVAQTHQTLADPLPCNLNLP